MEQMTINKVTTKDRLYKEGLAEAIGIDDINKLQAVVGPDQFTEVVRSLKAENYASGRSYENVKNGIYRANLHLHTVASDGVFVPITLFEDVRNYVSRPGMGSFLVAITDHDALLGSQGAVSYIAENSHDMDNVLFTPGIEFNCRYDNKTYFDTPIQIELLAYCINPFSAKLEGLIQSIKAKNKEILEKVFEEVADTEASVVEAGIEHVFIRNMAGPAIDLFLREYLKSKGIPATRVKEIFKKYEDDFVGQYLTAADPTMEEIVDAVEGSIVSIAHPTRIKVKSHLKAGMEDQEEAAFRAIFEDLHKLRGRLTAVGAEVHYQMFSWFVWEDAEAFAHRQKLILKYAEEFDFLYTGGMDTHGDSIFKR